MDWTVPSTGPLGGELRVPGDKSIAHRALLLAAIARGESLIEGLPDGADVRSTAAILAQLGVRIECDWPGPGAADARASARVFGVGLRGFRRSRQSLYCGNSGTTARLVCGLLAGQPFESTLDGDRSMRQRPMQRVAEPLCAMGATVTTTPKGTLPMRIGGVVPLRAVTHRPEVASAQIKSCVLLAGLLADGTSRVLEKMPTRDHTERLLKAMGVEIHDDSREPNSVCVSPPDWLATLTGEIPGDVSAAAYWLVAATLVRGSDLLLPAVGANPRRDQIVDLLCSWGADIERGPQWNWCGEPLCGLRVRAVEGPLKGGCVEAAMVPSLIDELPLLAALAPFTEEGVEIRGAAELRVKESDRIAMMAAAIRALGGETEEYPDGLSVRGATGLGGGVVDVGGDHRIGLALAAVGVAATGPVILHGCEAMTISYPRFSQRLEHFSR